MTRTNDWWTRTALVVATLAWVALCAHVVASVSTVQVAIETVGGKRSAGDAEGGRAGAPERVEATSVETAPAREPALLLGARR
jgi:hypothetical protein